MSTGPALRSSRALVRLRLGDLLIQTYADGEVNTVQATVALIRTIFEDHYVDPEHHSCLFFHGCTLAGAHNRGHDFSVVHRGDRVILSEFTFALPGGARSISLPIHTYTQAVVEFGEQVLGLGLKEQGRPDWQERYVRMYWTYLQDLLRLAKRFLADETLSYNDCCAEFQRMHGHLRRPLEIQVLEVLAEGAPREPITVLSRIRFGPVRIGERLPMRLNHGDVILVTVSQFITAGVVLTLEGVGSGGVRRGDSLYGLQLFYP